MTTSEIKIASQTIYDGKVIKVKKDTVKLPNGKTAFREKVEHGGGACVLAVCENKVVLVKQFRYAYGKEVLEIPAGKLEKGEDPKLCAERECIEETGLKPLNLKLVNEIYPSPGYTNEVIHLYVATEFEKLSQHLDSDEFLNVCYVDCGEFVQMAFRGEICDAKTLVAAYYLHSINN